MVEKQRTSSKGIGFWSATSIGIGAMIGAGLFALIGIAVEIAGRVAYLAFVIAGTVALLTSYSVSRLAIEFPSKGGPVEYLNRGWGRGVFAGGLNIVMWIGYVIVTALYARAFGDYAAALLGIGQDSHWLPAFSSAVVILFVLINFCGASAVGASELMIVAIKVMILLVFGTLGLTTMEAGKLAPVDSFDWGSIILASGVVFMSYEGFGLVANTAEDIRRPRKNLPRALYLSIVFTMIIYVMVSVAVIGNLSVEDILAAKEYALAEAAKPVMGALGFTVMGIAALFSTASAINATIYGPVNMLQETAHAGQITPFFTRRLLRHQSGYALLTTGVLTLLISILFDLEAIAETGSLIFLVVYTAINGANLRLRERTSSKWWIVWLAILGTGFSFILLLCFLIAEASLSVYIFWIVIVSGFAGQWCYQKLK